jgi:hypothetical protein
MNIDEWWADDTCITPEARRDFETYYGLGLDWLKCHLKPGLKLDNKWWIKVQSMVLDEGQFYIDYLVTMHDNSGRLYLAEKIRRKNFYL